MTNLSTFSENGDDAPILETEPRQRLPVPVLAETNGTAGVGGYLQSGKKAYVSPRVRKTHFFRMHKGYAFSDQILDYLQQSGITVLFIQESDTNDVLEYHISSFVDFGIPVEYTDGDPQTCVPEKYATLWQNHSQNLL